MNYDEMPAGREMDVAIAKHVLGKLKESNGTWFFNGSLAIQDCPKDKNWDSLDDTLVWKSGNLNNWLSSVMPHYSTNLAAAWEVVERMPIPFKLEKCWEKAYQIGPEGWSACWCTDADCEGCNENSRCTNGDNAWAETAPLVICRAALKALENGQSIKG